MPPKVAPPPPDASADPTRDLPFAYTSFFAPPPVNAKNVASQYLRNEAQSWTGRNAASQMVTNGTAAMAKGKKRRRAGQATGTGDATPSEMLDSDEDAEDEEQAPSSSSNTIVIHPGSHHLRIGLSSDLAPIAVPHILARRDRLTPQESDKTDGAAQDGGGEADDRETELSSGIDALRNDLKSIMRNMKLRPVANGRQQTANYNAGVKPESLAEHQDVFAVDWTESKKISGDVVLGEKAERLDCFSMHSPPQADRPWKLFQPFKGGHFNYHDYAKHYGTYACHAALLADVATIWSHAITAPKNQEKESASQVVEQGLGIAAKDWPFYNVLLVIPDLYLLAEVESLIGLLLKDMGFAGVMVQQESVCATFGAGLSSACVVHVGSERTHVTCVDEGFTVSDSRTTLGYGGDMISTFFMQLLQRANFPYSSFDQEKRLADRWLANELKERLCTLDPSQLGLAINDFHVRLPNKRTQKYSLRTYDEIIVGPMSLFTPRVLPLSIARLRLLPISTTPLVTDDEAGETEAGSLPTTLAMTNCVRHLLPAPPAPRPVGEAVNTANGSKQGTPAPGQPGTAKGEGGMTRVEELAGQGSATGASTPALQDDSTSIVPSQRASPVARAEDKGGATSNGNGMEIDKPSGTSIDIPFDASKASLDWAVWNSILASVASLGNASATEERIKRMVSNMFCTGGTALMPGLGMAIEARVHNYVSQWYTQEGKDLAGLPNATVVPPPRDMDPRIVTWKGSAVLARLDSAQDMWVLRNEWKTFGMRALREKAYFL